MNGARVQRFTAHASAHYVRMRVSVLLSMGLVLSCAAPLRAQNVLIYRCVAGDGSLTLRDSPCDDGERQDTRSMLRPQDPPPSPEPAPSPPQAPAAAPQREVQVVYRAPPRPMYECRTSDGDTYVSDEGEGNPRWVPLWTLGYPTWTGYRSGPRPPPTAGPGQPGVLRPGGQGGPGGPTGPRPGGPHPGSHGPRVAYAGGTWVRDQCHPLPQQEICSRLTDRRWEIFRRYNSASQSERRELDLEKRGIDARMANDCGAGR